MTRNNPATTPGWDARLQADLAAARTASALKPLRELGRRYNVQFPPSISVQDAKSRVANHIAHLAKSTVAGTPEDDPQGSGRNNSPANSLFEGVGPQGSPVAARLSYSQVAGAAHGMPSAAGRLTPLGKAPKSRTPLTTPSAAVQEAGPGPELGAGPAPADLSGAAGETGAGERPPADSSTLQQEVVSLRQELATLRATVARLQQQQQTSHATGLAAAQGVATLTAKVAKLQGESAVSQKLQEEVGILHSRQQQLANQQELEECQRAVVLRTPEPLPAGEPGAAGRLLNKLLGKQLSEPVTVLRVRQLGQRVSRGTAAGGKPSTYKVVLANSEQRAAVLRVKAQALRGTPHSIDACLTSQQRASRQAQLPAAKRAAAAGQRVTWRYDCLYIDGKEHGGTRSLPPPRRQQQQEGASPAAARPSPQPSTQREAPWQTVRPAKGRARKPKPGGDSGAGSRRSVRGASPPPPPSKPAPLTPPSSPPPKAAEGSSGSAPAVHSSAGASSNSAAGAGKPTAGAAQRNSSSSTGRGRSDSKAGSRQSARSASLPAPASGPPRRPSLPPKAARESQPSAPAARSGSGTQERPGAEAGKPRARAGQQSCTARGSSDGGEASSGSSAVSGRSGGGGAGAPRTSPPSESPRA